MICRENTIFAPMVGVGILCVLTGKYFKTGKLKVWEIIRFEDTILKMLIQCVWS